MLSITQAAELRAATDQARHFTGVLGPWLEHLVQDEGFSLEQAREGLNKWVAIPYVDPKHGHMATLIKRNREVHFAIYRRFRHRSHVTSRRIAEFLQPILDENVFLVTRIDKPEDALFIEHIGFEELGVDAQGLTCYILNAIKYPKVRHANPI